MSTTITATSVLPDPSPPWLALNTKTAIAEEPILHDPFDNLPSDLVEAALAMLCKESIPLIAWGSLLYRNMNVPKVLMHFQFLVPDELLDIASRKVSAMQLPLTLPPSLLLKTQGDLIRKGRLHRLTRDTEPGSVQYLHLLPLSFAGFEPSEWTTDRHPSYTVFVPRPSAAYAAILRIMASYPRKGAVRSSLEAELELLLDYHLLDLQLGYIDPDDDEARTALDVDSRVEKAVCTVRNWSADGEWRDGEEWMGDALIALLRNSANIVHYEHRHRQLLPWHSGQASVPSCMPYDSRHHL